jgi:hypothetical protein
MMMAKYELFVQAYRGTCWNIELRPVFRRPGEKYPACGWVILGPEIPAPSKLFDSIPLAALKDASVSRALHRLIIETGRVREKTGRKAEKSVKLDL